MKSASPKLCKIKWMGNSTQKCLVTGAHISELEPDYSIPEEKPRLKPEMTGCHFKSGEILHMSMTCSQNCEFSKSDETELSETQPIKVLLNFVDFCSFFY